MPLASSASADEAASEALALSPIRHGQLRLDTGAGVGLNRQTAGVQAYAGVPQKP